MNNNFHLVDSGWKAIINKAAKQSNQAKLRIICPFIKKRVIENLVQKARPSDIQIITRFNLLDFFNGVSDIAALQFLLKSGAQIRGIRNLHAKLYLFGESQVIVTSANLTDAALSRNHEFGFIADDEQIISHCHNYFDDLWNKAGSNLSLAQTDQWDKKVTEQLAKGAKPSSIADLGDEGVEADQTTIPPLESPPWVADANQAFVKFFGVSNDREDLSLPVIEEVKRAGCHWACTYPNNKRPR